MDNNEVLLRLVAIEDSIAAIGERNRRVESDKAWEVSFTRRATICFLTYVTTAGVFWCLSVDSPFRNALIPLCGYLISTLTVPWVKKIWLLRQN
jgi:hypothetical protein